jgi:hypothetical protein
MQVSFEAGEIKGAPSAVVYIMTEQEWGGNVTGDFPRSNAVWRGSRNCATSGCWVVAICFAAYVAEGPEIAGVVR